LRVRLSGSPGNRDGVGAVVRMISGGKPGPAREIHAGAGYWSQDSSVQVMTTAGTPSVLWIRWPGGGTNQVVVPVAAREVNVDMEGKVTVLR
jgi:enediyne biosynthesis protein E4